MNGECASLARRRAISVLPTPVGPIIRMFFGATSSASSGGSFCRRIRLRSAIATARLAFDCPTTYLSSSATISRGVKESMAVVVRSGRVIDILLQRIKLWVTKRHHSPPTFSGRSVGTAPEAHSLGSPLEFFNSQVVVRVDADLGRDGHRVLRNLARRQRRMARQRLGRCLRERAAGANTDNAVVGLNQIAGARYQEHR